MNIPHDDPIGDRVLDHSTIPQDPTPQEHSRENRLRNLTILFVVLVVALGTVGMLGVMTSTAIGDGAGHRLVVTYAAVTRGGLATPFAIEVDTEDGSALAEVLTIRVSSDYLALFDDNGMEPAPTNSFNTGILTVWEFEVPPGESTLEVVLDSRLEPAVQWGKQGTVELWIGDERIVSTEFRTWVMP